MKPLLLAVALISSLFLASCASIAPDAGVATSAESAGVKSEARTQMLVGSRIKRDKAENAELVKKAGPREYREGREASPGSPLYGGG